MRTVVLAILVLAAPARADLLSHDRLRAHVERLDIATTSFEELDTSRLAFMASALVPGFGTYRLEKRVFGEVRPAGILGDWGVGGAVPFGLLVASYYVDDSSTRRALRWTALGLYAGTRVAIFVIGNLHISEYRRALTIRFTTSANTAGIAIDF
jgi:hypothetical protein